MLDTLMISIPEYFASLKFSALLRALPGGVAQGLIWGVLALGVFLTFRMLGISDLTVDGSMATGGAVCIMLVLAGVNPQLALLASFLAGMAAGGITGFLHTKLGIPDILAGILTQISLYSINLNIMGKANQAVNVNKVSFWEKPGDKADYPQLQVDNWNGNWDLVDRDVEKVNWVKLKTFSLGYTLPEVWMKKCGVDELRLFVSGENLWTWTNYSGLDPETPGATYPLARSCSFGLSLGF